MSSSAFLTVPAISLNDSCQSDHTVFDSLPEQLVSNVPWPSYLYKPQCSFRMGHSGDNLFLKFLVEEKDIRITQMRNNEKVYQDSCVEFFIAFEDNGYYNLEFNPAGTMMLGYGTDRDLREFADEVLIGKIGRRCIINRKKELVQWELEVMIPVEIFFKHSYSTVAGKTAKANFYKCGDHLPEPHYLAWSNIKSAEPNFHLPQYFGILHFA